MNELEKLLVEIKFVMDMYYSGVDTTGGTLEEILESVDIYVGEEE